MSGNFGILPTGFAKSPIFQLLLPRLLRVIYKMEGQANKFMPVMTPMSLLSHRRAITTTHFGCLENTDLGNADHRPQTSKKRSVSLDKDAFFSHKINRKKKI